MLIAVVRAKTRSDTAAREKQALALGLANFLAGLAYQEAIFAH